MLAAAFAALFGSLLVVGLITAGLGESWSFRAGAVLLAACMAGWTARFLREFGRLAPESRALFNPRASVVIGTLVVASIAAQLIVALGLAGRAEFGLFYSGLFLTLLYVAFGFVRIMFVRPSSG